MWCPTAAMWWMGTLRFGLVPSEALSECEDCEASGITVGLMGENAYGALLGDAVLLAGGGVRLTEAAVSQMGSFILQPHDSIEAIRSFRAEFSLQIWGGRCGQDGTAGTCGAAGSSFVFVLDVLKKHDFRVPASRWTCQSVLEQEAWSTR